MYSNLYTPFLVDLNQLRRGILPDEVTELITSEVVAYLRISKTRVTQLLKEGRLIARFDASVRPNGCWFYTRASVAACKAERDAFPLKYMAAYARGAIAHEGVVAAKAFELFDQKKSVAEVVRILQVKPDRIRRLWQEYKTPLGQRVMTPEAERELFERQKTIKELEIADTRARAAMLAASKPKGQT